MGAEDVGLKSCGLEVVVEIAGAFFGAEVGEVEVDGDAA